VAHTHDEAFHEIQLNGKQLVFLFMAATVVSVVIFLCGVLVGRGVRAERSTSTEVASLGTPAEPVPQPQAGEPPPAAAGSDPTKAAPPAPADDLTYFDRLEKSKAPAEVLKSAEKSKAADAPATPPAAPKSVAEKKETAPTVEPRSGRAAVAAESKPPASTEPSGSGFAVQIAALNVRSEADAIARRLAAKGYAAYVLTPPAGTPAVFRVRVGKFPTRREAETVANKLQKEEQFKPWVTR